MRKSFVAFKRRRMKAEKAARGISDLPDEVLLRVRIRIIISETF